MASKIYKRSENGSYPMIIPSEVIIILTKLESAGFEAFLVGGCVRDLLLGLSPQDYDVCTEATPDEMLEVLSDFSVYKTGLRHGTLTIKSGEIFIEVTTYRREGKYSDNRHPDQVTFIGELREDLARRDFTINALACSRDGTIYDFFAGKADLESKTISCVGDPDKRFTEDSLRILRGLRFASALDFKIADETASAMRKNKELLKNVSYERIREELTKLLAGKAVGRILRYYHEILFMVLPELSKEITTSVLWEDTIKAVENIPALPILRWTALLKNCGKSGCLKSEDCSDCSPMDTEIAESIFKRLKFDNKTKKRILLLIGYQEVALEANDGHIKRLLNKIGADNLLNLILLKKASLNKDDDYTKTLFEQLTVFEKRSQQIITAKSCYTLKQLAIKGNDLIAMGINDGKEINSLLTKLLEAVMDDKCDNNKMALRQFLKETNRLN